MNGCEQLRERYAADWERMVTHPFVAGLGDGSLPREAFARYMTQDYLFIDTLMRLVASGVGRAPSVRAAKPLGEFLQTLLGAEDALFDNVFTRLDIERPDRARDILPVAARFTRFLLGLARRAPFELIATALYVTEGTYSDWAKRLTAAGVTTRDPLYRGWIDIHAEQSLEDFANYLAQHAASAEGGGARAERVFVRTLRYEIAFWDEFAPTSKSVPAPVRKDRRGTVHA